MLPMCAETTKLFCFRNKSAGQPHTQKMRRAAKNGQIVVVCSESETVQEGVKKWTLVKYSTNYAESMNN